MIDLFKSSPAIKLLIIFFILLFHFQLHAQDSLATVYFYKEGKFTGGFEGYIVLDGEKMIGQVKSNSVFEYRCKKGQRIFKAKTQSEASFKLTVEVGKIYFVECSLAVGVAVGRPSFRLASSEEAKRAIRKMDTDSNNIPVAIKEFQPSDTARALEHLYKRKRNGGTARGVVFGILGLSALINTINYQPTTVTINQGSAGTQTIPIDDSPPVGNYVVIALCTTVAITGFSQMGHYSDTNLQTLLQDYNKRQPIPQKIKGKLKEKDFK